MAYCFRCCFHLVIFTTRNLILATRYIPVWSKRPFAQKFVCMKTKSSVARLLAGTRRLQKTGNMKTTSILTRANVLPAESPGEVQLLDLEQLKLGHPQAQALMVRRYRLLARKIASRYLNQAEDIEEAVQDTFVRAFRALPGFRGECRLSTWLSKIAASVAINKLNSLRVKVQWENNLDEYAHRLSTGDCSHAVEQKERYLWLSLALQQLHAKDAAVIERFYLQEQSIDEIRQATGWTTSDIKSRLCRARRRLRKVIENQYAAAWAEFQC